MALPHLTQKRIPASRRADTARVGATSPLFASAVAQKRRLIDAQSALSDAKSCHGLFRRHVIFPFCNQRAVADTSVSAGQIPPRLLQFLGIAPRGVGLGDDSQHLAIVVHHRELVAGGAVE